MRQWCAQCGKIILLPNGEPDLLARPGDLCDDCQEALVESDRAAQEWREEEKLNAKLRGRP